MSIAEMNTRRKDKRFVAVVSDYELGMKMYRDGWCREDCATQRMQQGWDSMWQAEADAATSAYLVANGGDGEMDDPQDYGGAPTKNSMGIYE